MCAFVCVCVRLCVCVCVRAFVCVCVCARMRVFAAHVHTHECMHASGFNLFFSFSLFSDQLDRISQVAKECFENQPVRIYVALFSALEQIHCVHM